MSDKKFYQEVCKTLEYKKEIKKLQERINKAIEYIEVEGEHTDCSGEPIYYLDEEQEEELLEILKGENFYIK